MMEFRDAFISKDHSAKWANIISLIAGFIMTSIVFDLLMNLRFPEYKINTGLFLSISHVILILCAIIFLKNLWIMYFTLFSINFILTAGLYLYSEQSSAWINALESSISFTLSIAAMLVVCKKMNHYLWGIALYCVLNIFLNSLLLYILHPNYSSPFHVGSIPHFFQYPLLQLSILTIMTMLTRGSCYIDDTYKILQKEISAELTRQVSRQSLFNQLQLRFSDTKKLARAIYSAPDYTNKASFDIYYLLLLLIMTGSFLGSVFMAFRLKYHVFDYFSLIIILRLFLVIELIRRRPYIFRLMKYLSMIYFFSSLIKIIFNPDLAAVIDIFSSAILWFLSRYICLILFPQYRLRGIPKDEHGNYILD